MAVSEVVERRIVSQGQPHLTSDIVSNVLRDNSAKVSIVSRDDSMVSTFTWLDYSEHERRKMLDVIELFGERTTRDELGLGSVRDAFADLFFPGTSTIQTRAKYFLFVPWVYLKLEQKCTASSKVANRARKLEIELARQLEQSGETDGVIGRVAKEKLQRLPSSIYWQGLYQWGIRVFSGSQDEYHRSLDLFYERQRSRRASRHEHDGETADDPDLHNWHAGLPAPDDDFPNGVTLALEPHEAEYLRERILTNCPASMMAFLVREHVAVDDIRFAWELAADLPDTLRSQVEHGRNFSETMHGAQLLYNLLLGEMRSWDDRIDVYRGELDDWWQLISDRRPVLRAWDRREFWRIVRQSNPRVHPKAERFIEDWIRLVLDTTDKSKVVDGLSARQRVKEREVWLKGGLARVRNERALELWNGAAGAAQLDLRWTNARRIIADILTGREAHVDA